MGSSNRKMEYLDEGLSISSMYQLYLDKYEPKAETDPQAKEWLYMETFDKEFNLKFGYPRSDKCETCDLLLVTIQATSSEAVRDEMQKELADNQDKASRGYRLLRDDTKPRRSLNHPPLSFDLMQNLPLPNLTHGTMFYSGQLWVYNFGIHNTTNGDVVEAHATVLNCTVTFLSIHVAKTDFSETFRPRGSSSVTNNSYNSYL